MQINNIDKLFYICIIILLEIKNLIRMTRFSVIFFFHSAL